MIPNVKKMQKAAICASVVVIVSFVVALVGRDASPPRASIAPTTASATTPSSVTTTTVPGPTAQKVPANAPTGTDQSIAAHKIIYPTREAWNSGVRNSGTQKAASSGAIVTANTLRFQGQPGSIGVTTGPPKVYLVFWGSQWGTKTLDANGYAKFSGDRDGMAQPLQAMLKGLGTNGDAWSNVMTQYCENISNGATSCPASNTSHVGYPSGGTLAGVWFDGASAAPTSASPTEIENEASAGAVFFGNTSAAANRNVQYVVVSPPNTHPDGFNSPTGGFCAWHSAGYTGSLGTFAFTNLPYIPDALGSCGQNFVNSGNAGLLDGVTIVEGHEYAETITDQVPGNGWLNNSGLENGDLCAWVAPGYATGARNLSLATGSFAMQSTWSNVAGACATQNAISLTTPPDQTGYVQHAFSLQISATDTTGAAMTYQATGLPAGLTIGAATGIISGTPTTAGVASVAITVTDPSGSSATTDFSFTVQRWLLAISPLAAQSLVVNNPFNLQVNATDSGQIAMTYSASGLPSGITINSSSGLITGRTAAQGTFSVTVTVSDVTQSTTSASFVLTVRGPPSLPLNTSASATSNQITVYWSAPAVGGDVTSYNAVASPGGSSCTTAATSCTLSGLSPATTYQVTVSATNAYGTGPIATISVATGQPTSLGVYGQIRQYQAVYSPDGRFVTVMQGDGNLVTYGPSGPLWASGTSGRGGNFVVFQGDGNLVMYNIFGGAIWASGSKSTHPGALIMQGDGNFVAYNTNAQAIWSARTGPLAEPAFAVPPGARSAIGPGETLGVNQALYAGNGSFMAVMQGDGNFVVYGQGGPIWSTGTFNHPGAFLTLQSDGNVVVYSSSHQALWASWSSGWFPPAILVLQGDGNFVEYNIFHGAMWASRR